MAVESALLEAQEEDEDGLTSQERPTSSLNIEDLDRNTIIAAIREALSTVESLDRETALRETARALGFARTGPRIAEAIDSALIAAARRGIIQNNRGLLSIATRNISDHSRDELIAALLGSTGNAWQERDEAIRAAARYLGFRRAGRAIRDAFKSVINGAIRRGLLEYEGMMIRKLR